MTPGICNLAVTIGHCTRNAGRCNKRLIRWRNRAWSVDGLSGAVALVFLLAWTTYIVTRK